MEFEPDILVTARDSDELLMVVETKLSTAASAENEKLIRRYLWRARCPLGLIVTPEWFQIFRDQYRLEGEDAIVLVGTFPIPRIESGLSGVDFESRVQEWLDELRWRTKEESWSPEAWEAMSWEILPILRSGDLRAAHPRLKTA